MNISKQNVEQEYQWMDDGEGCDIYEAPFNEQLSILRVFQRRQAQSHTRAEQTLIERMLMADTDDG